MAKGWKGLQLDDGKYRIYRHSWKKKYRILANFTRNQLIQIAYELNVPNGEGLDKDILEDCNEMDLYILGWSSINQDKLCHHIWNHLYDNDLITQN